MNWNEEIAKKELYSPQRFEDFLAHHNELEPLYNIIFKALEEFHNRVDADGYLNGFNDLGSINFEVMGNKLTSISFSNIMRDHITPIPLEGLDKIKNIEKLLHLAFHCNPYEGEKEKSTALYVQTYGEFYMKSQELPRLTLIYRGGEYKKKYSYHFDYINHRQVLSQYDPAKVITDIYDFFHRRNLELNVPKVEEIPTSSPRKSAFKV